MRCFSAALTCPGWEAGKSKLKRGGVSMKIIKFVKPHSPYAVNDVAGIPDKEADELIEAGVAVKFDKKSADKEVEAEPEVQPETEAVEEPAEDKMVKKAKTK